MKPSFRTAVFLSMLSPGRLGCAVFADDAWLTRRAVVVRNGSLT